MLKSIKREFLLNLDSLGQMLAIEGAAWALGLAINVVVLFVDPRPLFIVGKITTGMAFVFLALLIPAYYFSVSYEQALRMGCTRRRFIGGMLCTAFLQLLITLAAVCALGAAEEGIGRLFLKERYDAGKMHDWLPQALRYAGAALIVLAGVVFLGAFLGACVQRWGRKAFWSIYAFSMVCCAVGTAMPEGGQEDVSAVGRAMMAVGNALAFIPGGAWAALGILAVLACGVWGVWLLLTGSVRN